MTLRSPVATWTSGSYVISGLAVAAVGQDFSGYVIAGALFVLAIGSAWMHATRGWGTPETLDHAGMHATMAALATYLVGGGPLAVLLAAVLAPMVLEWWMDVGVEAVMGVYLWFCIWGAWPEVDLLSLALAFLAAGFWFWRQGGDTNHGLWHVGTAMGLLLLYLAG